MKTLGNVILVVLILLFTGSILGVLTGTIQLNSNDVLPVLGIYVLITIVLILTFIKINKKNEIKQNKISNPNETSFSKAVINHSKDIASEIKPTIDEYKEKHSTTKNENLSTKITEDKIYEKIMIEIEEDKKVKSTWAKALAQSDGDKDKAESIYIKFRFVEIKNETYKDIELLKMKEINKQEEEIKIKNENIEYKKLLKEEEERISKKSNFDIEKEKYLNDYNKRKKEEELKTKLEIFLKKEELIIIDTISDSEVIAKNKSNPLKLKLKYSNSSWYVDEII